MNEVSGLMCKKSIRTGLQDHDWNSQAGLETKGRAGGAKVLFGSENKE